MNEYEQERAKRIADNQARLAALGLHEAVDELVALNVRPPPILARRKHTAAPAVRRLLPARAAKTVACALLKSSLLVCPRKRASAATPSSQMPLVLAPPPPPPPGPALIAPTLATQLAGGVRKELICKKLVATSSSRLYVSKSHASLAAWRVLKPGDGAKVHLQDSTGAVWPLKLKFHETNNGAVIILGARALLRKLGWRAGDLFVVYVDGKGKKRVAVVPAALSPGP